MVGNPRLRGSASNDVKGVTSSSCPSDEQSDTMLLGRLKIVISDPPKQTHAITHTYNHTNSEEKKQRNWDSSVAAGRSQCHISNYSLSWLDTQKHQRRFMKLLLARSSIRHAGHTSGGGVTRPASRGSACRTPCRSGWWRGCCQPCRAPSCCRSTSQPGRPRGKTSRVCASQMSPGA